MKTTSYEISKQLAKAGFDKSTDFYYTCRPNVNDDYHIRDTPHHIYDKDQDFYEEVQKGNFIAGYDLETILEALPKTFIIIESDDSQCEDKYWLNIEVFGDNDNDQLNFFYSSEYRRSIRVNQIPGESLADNAARLLLLLIEKGLIKL